MMVLADMNTAPIPGGEKSAAIFGWVGEHEKK
jgi:hypothetical protein